MNYIVAVSGGVDSIVLLDKIYRRHDKHNKYIVAHVNHGIRADADDDERFVAALAAYYGYPFVSSRLNLDSKASEELARTERYKYLFAIAKQFKAQIITAHHADDVVGSIMINHIRGTGWRGLAVMQRLGIVRPLRHYTKRQIIDYALENRLEWVEDSTNRSLEYLRNRLRPFVNDLSDLDRTKLLDLWRQQTHLMPMIEKELTIQVDWLDNSRYKLIHCPEAAARELLRAIVIRQTGQSLTRPQQESVLLFVKTAASDSTIEVTQNLKIKVSRDRFIVQQQYQ